MAELIAALDCASRGDARRLVDALGGAVGFYKVGSVLFSACGPAVVGDLRDRGKRVFLDLKYCDIPNTVAGAVDAACALEVDLLTVHAYGGREMAAAAARARDRRSSGTRIVAVTVLTSLDGNDLGALGIAGDPAAAVARFAGLARDWGLDGVVCSGAELADLRGRFPRPFALVCPGIRPAAAGDDQKRCVSPAAAVAAGADYLVVGRPIAAAADPAAAAAAILREMTHA